MMRARFASWRRAWRSLWGWRWGALTRHDSDQFTGPEPSEGHQTDGTAGSDDADHLLGGGAGTGGNRAFGHLFPTKAGAGRDECPHRLFARREAEFAAGETGRGPFRKPESGVGAAHQRD